MTNPIINKLLKQILDLLGETNKLTLENINIYKKLESYISLGTPEEIKTIIVNYEKIYKKNLNNIEKFILENPNARIGNC